MVSSIADAYSWHTLSSTLTLPYLRATPQWDWCAGSCVTLAEIKLFAMGPVRLLTFTLIAVLATTILYAQDGKIISKELLILPDSTIQQLTIQDSQLILDLKRVNLYRITYLSDGLKVIGFLAEPKQKGKYPCIISNRGGRWNFGLWNPYQVAYYLGRMATWGYVVAASQYRGSVDGSQGKDEYGGKDVNDVFNLIPVLTQQVRADTSRIGLDGHSRGGMMSYLVLKRSCRFKAAVVLAGLADAFDIIKQRPELEERTYRPAIPGYLVNKDSTLRERSAIFWPEQLCKTTPLLLMHGSADWRADAATQSIRLVEKLYQCKHPLRFVLFEGGDHNVSQYPNQVFAESKRHFDDYLRDSKPLPNLHLPSR